MILIEWYLSIDSSATRLRAVATWSTHVPSWTILHAARFVYGGSPHLVHFENRIWCCLGARGRWVGSLRIKLLPLPTLTISTTTLGIGINLALLQINPFLPMSIGLAAVLGPRRKLLCVAVRPAYALLLWACVQVVGSRRTRQDLRWFWRRRSTAWPAASCVACGIWHDPGVETVWLAILPGHGSIRLLLEASVRWVSSPQVNDCDHWLAANWITIITLGTVHESRVRQVSTRVVWAVGSTVAKLAALTFSLQSNARRQLRIGSLLEGSCRETEGSISTFIIELEGRGVGWEIKFACIIVLVLPLDHAAKPTHPARIPEHIHFFDALWSRRSRSLLQLFALI